MAVVKITKDNFESEVVKADKPVFLDFWATWCGPCQMVGPVVDEISNELSTIKVGKVNVDEEPELAAQFKVMSIPMMVLMKDGEMVRKTIGAQPKNEILKFIQG